MKTGTYYLNKQGSKWVVLDQEGRRERLIFTTKSGRKVRRRVIYYESFGNHAVCAISWKGHLIKVFADTLLDD